MVTTESFRQTFRMFNDVGDYPDDSIVYYTTLGLALMTGASSAAGNRLAADPVILDRAVSLYIAHFLSLDARDAETVAAGGIPGELEGAATGKTVDKVSVSMDAGTVTFDNEPFWNQTRFGVQLIDLVRMFGAGGIQLGTPNAGDFGTVFYGW